MEISVVQRMRSPAHKYSGGFHLNEFIDHRISPQQGHSSAGRQGLLAKQIFSLSSFSSCAPKSRNNIRKEMMSF